MCLCVCVLSARPDAGSPLGPCSPLPKSLETSGHRGGHQHTGADALKTGENRNVRIQESSDLKESNMHLMTWQIIKMTGGTPEVGSDKSLTFLTFDI